MRRSVIRFSLVVIAVLGICCIVQSSAQPEFDRAKWFQDFDQLLTEMSTHYANLEWAVQERRMDLPALREETEKNLSAATDKLEARRAMEQFVRSFGDGHFEIRWPKANTSSSLPDQPAQHSLCSDAGYKAPARISEGLQFSLVDGFTASSGPDTRDFPGGLLDLGGTRLGILRIALFDEHAHPAACENAIKQLRINPDQQCDEQCKDRIEGTAASLLAETLARRADELRHSGATALLVDITHNGGGSNWAELPPRILSPAPLSEPRSAFIKHEHWTRQLQDRLADIETDIRNKKEPTEVLEEARSRLLKGIAETKEKCDRSPLWITGKIDCSLLVRNILYTDGLLPYAKPGSFPSLESRTSLFHPLYYSYAEGRNKLPLYVAVDRETWSAAEYFAAILQDNHAAVIVGEVTGGAGCGYTNGGIPTTLKNSQAVVKMPDCVRLRKDGTNEVNGVLPDVLLPWTDHDIPYTKVTKIMQQLKASLPAPHP
jgi:hypothetical protein